MSIIGTFRDGTDGTVASVEARKQTPTKNNALAVCIGPGDLISNLPITMTYDHHQIHEGETFRYSTYASLSSAGNLDLKLVVPNITIVAGAVQQCPHLRFQFLSSGAADAYFYEGTTFSNEGSAQTPIALERNGTYTSKLTPYTGVTVNAVGTQLFRGLLSTSKNDSGTIETSANEFVLKNNTVYLLRITSGTNSNPCLIRAVWYEDLGV